MYKNALLIDLDSTIPNLALMKASAAIKKGGGSASFTENNPDSVFISCIFTRNKNKALSAANMCRLTYPDAYVDVGGSGVDIHKKMFDNKYDLIKPDYSLYPDIDYSLGYTTRGCIRHCYFCIVHDKEGDFHIRQHPREFHDSRFDKIKILDNNILADKEWFMKVTDWVLSEGLKIDINQGLDIRLIDKDIAVRLSELKPFPEWKFAFDSMAYKKDVIRGLDILKENGVNPRNKCLFYVYIHNDAAFDDALTRCELLKEWGTQPYLMINQETVRTPRMTALKRWCRPWIMRSCDFKDYDKAYHNKKGE